MPRKAVTSADAWSADPSSRAHTIHATTKRERMRSIVIWRSLPSRRITVASNGPSSRNQYRPIEIIGPCLSDATTERPVVIHKIHATRARRIVFAAALALALPVALLADTL